MGGEEDKAQRKSEKYAQAEKEKERRESLIRQERDLIYVGEAELESMRNQLKDAYGDQVRAIG